MLGVLGVGKGMQVQFIIECFDIFQIFIGDMLCVVVKVEFELGFQVKEVMVIGGLVFDDIIIVLIEEWIQQLDCKNGFLFDGFLCIIFQVEVLKDQGIVIDYVVEIFVDDEEIVSCLFGCCVYEVSGWIYYVKYDLFKVEGKDDEIGEFLVQCEDDKEEIVCKCLKIYYDQMVLLIGYYQDWVVQILEVVFKYVQVVGVGSFDSIWDQILIKLQ